MSLRDQLWRDALAGCPLFAGLSEDDLLAVAALAGEKRVRRKGVFFREGEPLCALHLLLAGEVVLKQASVDGQEVIVRMVGPGEVLALAAALEGAAYPVTAEALRASHALVWEQSVVQDLLRRLPSLCRNAVTVLLLRIRDLEQRFREIATERVAQRLARALIRLARQAGRKVGGGVLIDLPISREELAQMTGTTLFTVSRCLAEWERQGLIEAGRERVLIRSTHGLVSIAEDLASADR
jgi:CRP-like cAMP-binding protein